MSWEKEEETREEKVLIPRSVLGRRRAKEEGRKSERARDKGLNRGKEKKKLDVGLPRVDSE